MAESSGNDISQTSFFIVQISAESGVNGMGLAVMIFSVVRFVSLFVFLAEFKAKEMELAVMIISVDRLLSLCKLWWRLL